MPSPGKGWIAVDFDGTLATYEGNFTTTGKPIPIMVARVKAMIAKGHDVRIFTARISHKNVAKKMLAIEAVEEWCVTHIGKKLPVTNIKDFNCIAIYDDKAIQVIPNTGMIVTRRGIKR